jgi:uncharacterized protein (DUF362 family)
MRMVLAPSGKPETPSPPPASSRSKVAVLRTRPDSVWDDVARAMRLADYEQQLPKDVVTGLKINITWQIYYPGCSTTPWQLEGVIRTLLEDGYERERMLGVHNRTVVVDSKGGEINNKHAPVLRKMGVGWIHTFEPGIEWTRYEPKTPMLVLDKIFPDGIEIPKMLVGMNMIHMPTMKTHVFTGTTGAMKNAFGGLLHDRRHWTHSVIHETLVDLLAIQKEIHPGVFAVMDGTIAGDGAGPRAMVPHVANLMLASADQVAIDAVAAKLMGFDPLKFKYIRLAHELGLGCGDVREIEIVGEDISGINLGFHGNQDTLASRGQKLIYHGPLKPLEGLLLRSPIVPWSYAASRLYHDVFWYPFVGRPRVKKMLRSEWGELFRNYPLEPFSS